MAKSPIVPERKKRGEGAPFFAEMLVVLFVLAAAFFVAVARVALRSVALWRSARDRSGRSGRGALAHVLGPADGRRRLAAGDDLRIALALRHVDFARVVNVDAIVYDGFATRAVRSTLGLIVSSKRRRYRGPGRRARRPDVRK
jgi:hypothetical protein